MRHRYLKFSQPAGEFYFVVLPAADVVRMARPKPRTYDPSKHISGGGVQREANLRRAREIASYTEMPDAAFPTSIILSFPHGSYLLHEATSELEFSESREFADVVDGQHRLLGLKDSTAIDRFELPVVVLLEANVEQEALLFATINGKQNRVNASLIFELFAVAEGLTPYKTAHEVARVLNSSPESPWFDRLKMLGKASYPDSDETITQGTFVRELLPYLSSDVNADFKAARSGAPLPPDPRPPLRRYMLAGEEPTIAKILMNLFGAQQDTWPEEWANPKLYVLRKTTGFMGTMWALEDLLAYGARRKSMSRDVFREIFSKVKAKLDHRGQRLTGQDFPSSSQGIGMFRDLIKSSID